MTLTQIIATMVLPWVLSCVSVMSLLTSTFPITRVSCRLKVFDGNLVKNPVNTVLIWANSILSYKYQIRFLEIPVKGNPHESI